MAGTLAIVGTGLIGASVGLAAREAGGWTVNGWDPDPDALAGAEERGACAGHADLDSVLADATLAVVAAPVTVIPSLVEDVLARAPEGCTEVGRASCRR